MIIGTHVDGVDRPGPQARFDGPGDQTAAADPAEILARYALRAAAGGDDRVINWPPRPGRDCVAPMR